MSASPPHNPVSLTRPCVSDPRDECQRWASRARQRRRVRAVRADVSATGSGPATCQREGASRLRQGCHLLARGCKQAGTGMPPVSARVQGGCDRGATCQREGCQVTARRYLLRRNDFHDNRAALARRRVPLPRSVGAFFGTTAHPTSGRCALRSTAAHGRGVRAPAHEGPDALPKNPDTPVALHRAPSHHSDRSRECAGTPFR